MESLFDPREYGPTFDTMIPPVDLDLRRFACPVCQANPGAPCKRPSGHAVFGGDVHAPRRQLAHDQARLEANEAAEQPPADWTPAGEIPSRDEGRRIQYAKGPPYDPTTASFNGPPPRWVPCPACDGDGCTTCDGAGELCVRQDENPY